MSVSVPSSTAGSSASSAPVLAPGDYATLCDSATYQASSGVAYPLHCDYVWTDSTKTSMYVGTYHDNTFYFRATADSVELYSGGNRSSGLKVDSLSWVTSPAWPQPTTSDPLACASAETSFM